MNIEEVINVLKNKDNSKELYFCEKNKDSYESVCPEVSEEIFDILIQNAIESISDRVQNERIQYNPTGFREGTLEMWNVDYVGNYNEIVQSFDPNNIEIESGKIERFSFYCVKIGEKNDNVKIFRRLTKFKKLSTHGFLGIFKGNQLNKIDSQILGIDGDVDLIVYKEEILILNHISLERIFKIEEQYEKKSRETIDFLRSTGKIENFDEFEEDCMNNLLTRKILTKMQNEDNDLSKCFDNFENIVTTINVFELPINVNMNTKSIIYEGKDQIKDILLLARDSYYKSLIQEKPGIDNKV